jgi:hypothetical protein
MSGGVFNLMPLSGPDFSWFQRFFLARMLVHTVFKRLSGDGYERNCDFSGSR